jgi:hypothetical protein
MSDLDMVKDIQFLLKRAMQAGRCSFGDDRDTGASSNSIVAIAYGLDKLKNQKLPMDMSDLKACCRMWRKLPKHRKTVDAHVAMRLARAAVKK